MKLVVLVACVFLFVACTKAQTNPPITRTVTGPVLTSKDTPAVRLEFDPAFKYAGAQSFVLYDVANAEQHFFVDADKEGRIKRFYWIQFEGYLPTNTHTYNYKSAKVVKAGGFEFIVDTYARSVKPGDTGRPNSDGARARELLTSKGFRMPGAEVIYVRLVHMVDEAKRNELMIIYMEDLTELGLTAADLAERGAARARWPEVEKGILDRALKYLKVSK